MTRNGAEQVTTEVEISYAETETATNFLGNLSMSQNVSKIQIVI